jgi:hypothetical protein
MAEYELEFEASTVGDQASEIKFQQLADDPNVYDLSMADRGSDGNLIRYKTRD